MCELDWVVWVCQRCEGSRQRGNDGLLLLHGGGEGWWCDQQSILEIGVAVLHVYGDHIL